MWGIITVMTCDAKRRLPWTSTIFHQATEDLLTFLTFFLGPFSWFSTNCQVTEAETDSPGSLASTRITWLSRVIISEFFATVMAVCRLSPRWQRKLVCFMYKPLSNQNWAPPPSSECLYHFVGVLSGHLSLSTLFYNYLSPHLSKLPTPSGWTLCLHFPPDSIVCWTLHISKISTNE